MEHREEEGETDASRAAQQLSGRWLLITMATGIGAAVLSSLTVSRTPFGFAFFLVPILPFVIGLRHLRNVAKLQREERARTGGHYKNPVLQWVINEHPFFAVFLLAITFFAISGPAAENPRLVAVLGALSLLVVGAVGMFVASRRQ